MGCEPGADPWASYRCGEGPGHCKVTKAWTSQNRARAGLHHVHIWACGRPSLKEGGDVMRVGLQVISGGETR